MTRGVVVLAMVAMAGLLGMLSRAGVPISMFPTVGAALDHGAFGLAWGASPDEAERLLGPASTRIWVESNLLRMTYEGLGLRLLFRRTGESPASAALFALTGTQPGVDALPGLQVGASPVAFAKALEISASDRGLTGVRHGIHIDVQCISNTCRTVSFQKTK